MAEQWDPGTDALAAELAEAVARAELPPETAAGLVDAVRGLGRDAALAVGSLAGLSLVHDVPGGALVVTALRPGTRSDDIAASLQIPVLAGGVGLGRCVALLYATEPAAFAELADVLRPSLDEEAGPLLVDQHLELPPETRLSALQDAAAHDLAEGVLVGRGFSEVGAVTFLEALTAASGGDPVAAAQQVLQSVG